jgi:hypothetical protein
MSNDNELKAEATFQPLGPWSAYASFTTPYIARKIPSKILSVIG